MNNDFENISMTNLRDVLCKIFFDDENMKDYIVPLQGNWYNPIQKNGVDNWIGYVIDTIKTNVSVVNANWHNNCETDNYVRSCQTSIHLSFIGKDAEAMAQSVLFWNARADVSSLFDKKYKGVMNNKEIVVYASLYQQEGLSSTLCWNVDFSIQHNMLLTSGNAILTGIDVSGDVIIGG